MRETIPQTESGNRCIACVSIERAASQEALFFLAYTAGGDDAGALPGREAKMCPEHAAMRDKILDLLERDEEG